MKTYFDFHCHSASKSFMTDEDMDKKKSPWEKLNGSIPQLLAPILSSQASFKQASDGKVNLLVASIVPLERGYTRYWLIKKVVGSLTALSKPFIKAINRREYSFYDLLTGEVDFIQKHQEFNGKRLNILTCAEDIIEEDENVINILYNIEGCHALDARKKGHKHANFLDNLIELKKREDFNCFYLTFTHINRMDLCNHAYAAKITHNKIFKPLIKIKGLGRNAEKLIDECYSIENGPRILVDTKHMSLFARKEFYEYRKKKGYDEIPIIASHVGVTGIPATKIGSAVDREKCKHRKKYVKIAYKDVPGLGIGEFERTFFNPWSINLYDEEIHEIMKSDGLIGVSLDQRILGYDNIKPEFFSKKEWEALNQIKFEILPDQDPMTDFDPILTAAAEEDFELLEDLDEEDTQDGGPIVNIENLSDEELTRAMAFEVQTDKFPPIDDLTKLQRIHLRFLCNNILHIVKVGGLEAWKFICIGSDFDGLINPINNCKRINDLERLEEDLLSELETMIQNSAHPSFSSVPVNLEEKVRDIMYRNGKRFIDKYFNKQAIGLN